MNLDGLIDTAFLASNGYELVNGEYVRDTPLLTPEAVSDYVEKNIIPFFNGLGFEFKRIPRSSAKTVDFECGSIGLEVTALQAYLPKCDEVDKVLKRYIEKNSRICAYMYLRKGKPKIVILDEQESYNNTSILCLRQHVSCYRPKLLRKIDEKYRQDETHDLQIVNIDFRLAHFDSLSLKWEIKSLLETNGSELRSLAGILMSVPNRVDANMFDEPIFVFVRNPHFTRQHKILDKLDNYSLATTSDWLTINHTFVRNLGLTRIPVPCLDCPEKEELSAKKLPTFLMNPV